MPRCTLLLTLKAVPADIGGHVEQRPLQTGLLLQLSLDAAKHALEDARHGNHDRGPDMLQVIGQLHDGARIGHAEPDMTGR